MTKPESIKRVDPPVERISDDPPRQVPFDAFVVGERLAEVGRLLRAAFAPPTTTKHAEILAAVRREVEAARQREGVPSRVLSGRHTWRIGVDPAPHKVDSVAAAALAYYGTADRDFTPPPAPTEGTVHGVYVNGQAVELEDGKPVKIAAGDSVRISTHRVGDRIVARVHVTPKAEPMPKRPKRRELEAELQRTRNQVTELEAQLLTARARNSRLSTRLDRSARRLNHALDAAERRTPAPGPHTGTGPYRPRCGSLHEHNPHPIGGDGLYCYGCHDYGVPDVPAIRVAPAGLTGSGTVEGTAGGQQPAPAPRYRIKDNPQA